MPLTVQGAVGVVKPRARADAGSGTALPDPRQLVSYVGGLRVTTNVWSLEATHS